LGAPASRPGVERARAKATGRRRRVTVDRPRQGAESAPRCLSQGSCPSAILPQQHTGTPRLWPPPILRGAGTPPFAPEARGAEGLSGGAERTSREPIPLLTPARDLGPAQEHPLYRVLLGFRPTRPNVSSRTTAAHHPVLSFRGGRGLYSGSYLSRSFLRAMVALRVMSPCSPGPGPTPSPYSSCPRVGTVSSLVPSSSAADAKSDHRTFVHSSSKL
jgi:hypothetical protein